MNQSDRYNPLPVASSGLVQSVSLLRASLCSALAAPPAAQASVGRVNLDDTSRSPHEPEEPLQYGVV